LTSFSLGSGILALTIEVFVALSLTEMPPFGKGGSDIIWALPFFALFIFALATPALLVALRATHQTGRANSRWPDWFSTRLALQSQFCCPYSQWVAFSFRLLPNE